MGHLMTALGAHVERVIINDLKNATYYARMIIRAENELQQKKIIELDGRPSDCIAMATQQKAPIYVSQEVWDEVDDMSDVLRKMEEEGLKPDPEAESTKKSSGSLTCMSTQLNEIYRLTRSRSADNAFAPARTGSASRISGWRFRARSSFLDELLRIRRTLRLCTARFTRGTSDAPALSSSMPRPSKSGVSAISPAISPQTPTQILFACARIGHHFEQPHHRRMRRLVKMRDALVHPIDRDRVLNEIVRADAEKIDFARERVAPKWPRSEFRSSRRLHVFVERQCPRRFSSLCAFLQHGERAAQLAES